MAYADTPIEMRQPRDCKGLYASARRSGIVDITGAGDPYGAPRRPVTARNAVDHCPEENAKAIVEFLEERGFLISP
jgi:sulfate adenylyltransferase